MFKLTTLQFDTQEELLNMVRVHTAGCDKQIGEGAYAVVYATKNPDIVMKLSCGDDVGYLSYLKTLEALNISNRYLPVIHEATHYRLTDEARKCGMWLHKERIVTYMERLKQPPKLNRKEYNKYGGLAGMFWPPVKKWTRIVSDYVLGDTRHIAHLSLEHQELIVFLKIAHEFHLAEVEKTQGFGRLDLHAGNAMCRGKTFVVTDPLT